LNITERYLGAFMNEQELVFDWDAANLDHIAMHDVTQEEVEQAILGDPLDIEMQIEEDGSGEERLQHIGETAKGRILQLMTTWRDGKVRVISAWDAPKQLKLYYLAEMRRLYGDTEDSEV
jgi:uncharacterized DUF497 family protein